MTLEFTLCDSADEVWKGYFLNCSASAPGLQLVGKLHIIQCLGIDISRCMAAQSVKCNTYPQIYSVGPYCQVCGDCFHNDLL